MMRKWGLVITMFGGMGLFLCGSSAADEQGTPGTGVCCFVFGGCMEESLPEDCLLADGDLFLPGVTECLEDTCPVGACCLGVHFCDMTSATGCEYLGGSYFPDSSCIPGHPCPEGACCLTDGVCDVITPLECESDGGAYRGDESTCFSWFVDCMSGPSADAPPGCECADMNSDGHVDLLDFAEFQLVFDGS